MTQGAELVISILIQHFALLKRQHDVIERIEALERIETGVKWETQLRHAVNVKS